jgi:hypothetical protein
MWKTEALLREGRAKLDLVSARMLSPAPSHSVLARRRKLMNFEKRYAEVTHRFELLRESGAAGATDLKAGLERAWDAFKVEIKWER